MLQHSVLGFDAIKLFKHGFGSKPEEKEGCGGVDAVQRKACEIVCDENVTVKCSGPHESGSKINHSAVEYNCCQSTEYGYGYAPAVEKALTE